MIKLRHCIDICPNCQQAIKMANALKRLKVDIEIDNKNKAPWFDHPIVWMNNDERISGDVVLNKLAEIGGKRIK